MINRRYSIRYLNGTNKQIGKGSSDNPSNGNSVATDFNGGRYDNIFFSWLNIPTKIMKVKDLCRLRAVICRYNPESQVTKLEIIFNLSLQQ